MNIVTRREYGRRSYALHRAASNKRSKERYATHREECKKYSRNFYKEHRVTIMEKAKEAQKQWRDTHREFRRERDAAYYSKNKEKIKEQGRLYYKTHREEHEEYQIKYYNDHRESCRVYMRNYFRLRSKRDGTFRMLHNLRNRVWKVLKGYSKSARTMKLVGCSIKFLKKHLENQFKPEMNWDNYGKWHVDHIRPCALFDLSKPSEQSKCFNYKNLQPLWAKENLIKGDNFDY